jgi:hypothetical protein
VRYIDIAGAPALPEKWIAFEANRSLSLAELASDRERIKFVRDNAGWSELKAWLFLLSGEKCWYCEAREWRAPLDVDHFRPKLAVTVDGLTIAQHGGYWWLAYDWRNYRLSCQRCNRPNRDPDGVLRGKTNEFPLRDESKRNFSKLDSILNEEPRLLDPCHAEDPKLLVHGLNGEVYPAAEPSTWDYERAAFTIHLLWFNEPKISEYKRERWQVLNILLNSGDPRTINEVGEQVKRCIGSRHEYSAFFRSVIATHRDKAWVDALL